MRGSWRKPCEMVLGLLLLLASSAVRAQGAKESYPIQGLTPREKIGGLVSIPGNPLPPLPEDSVKDAIVIYEPILTGMRIFGETPALARGLGYLATLYVSVGEGSKAEQLFDEAQTILEKKGATGRDLGWVYNNRGLARQDQQRYAEAAQSFRAGVAALSPERQELLEPRAIVLQNLATTYHYLGDVEHAEDAYLGALEILRRLRKEKDRTSRFIRGNLAILYVMIGDHAAARKLLEKLVDEQGMESGLHFATLNNLSMALRGMRDFRTAAERLEQAQVLAPEGSRERALVLINLAETFADGGDLEKASQVGERALRLAEELYGKGSRAAAVAERTLGTVALARGDLTRADSLLTRARTTLSKEGGDQQPLAIVTQSLALVAQRRGERTRALELGRQVLDLEKKTLDRILAFASEEQRLAYRSAFSYDQIANLEDATLLADAALATKGVVLESLLAERALVRKSHRAEDRERLDRIHGLKVELMEKIGRGETRLDVLERTLKNEETALAKSVARAASAERSRVDLAQVQAALECDQVLIEIVRFQHYEAGGKLAPWYGGVVIPHQGPPAWVPLGRAEGLEDLIESLVERLDAGNRGVERIPMLGDVTRTLRELDDRLWRPLVKVFPAGARKVLLSPDGALSFVPWAALLNEDETFLAESWQLTQVGSGRDLLRTATRSSERTLLALADGKEDLPFARQEVESLAHRAEAQGWRPTVLLGEQASEAALFQRHSPRILHFATHGGALQGNWAQAVGDRLSKRPMYRGFLWLGGAEKTLEAWKRGKVLPFSDDGVLTAEEVGGLDLGGTWLTVLSACQTGAGDARVGEGVLGLRRGFALAGTENLLFTLWSVDDESTAQFMETFYDRLFQAMDPPRAFQEAQVTELLRWKQDGDISAAVSRAGAFVLTR